LPRPFRRPCPPGAEASFPPPVAEVPRPPPDGGDATGTRFISPSYVAPSPYRWRRHAPFARGAPPSLLLRRCCDPRRRLPCFPTHLGLLPPAGPPPFGLPAVSLSWSPLPGTAITSSAPPPAPAPEPAPPAASGSGTVMGDAWDRPSALADPDLGRRCAMTGNSSATDRGCRGVCSGKDRGKDRLPGKSTREIHSEATCRRRSLRSCARWLAWLDLWRCY